MADENERRPAAGRAQRIEKIAGDVGGGGTQRQRAVAVSWQVNGDSTDVVRKPGEYRPPLAGAATYAVEAKSVEAWSQSVRASHRAAPTGEPANMAAGVHGAWSGRPDRRSTAAEWMPPNPLAVTSAVLTSHHRDRFGT